MRDCIIGRSKALIDTMVKERKEILDRLTYQPAQSRYIQRQDGNGFYAYKASNFACVLSAFASLKGKYNLIIIRK